jgi:4-hydroxy-tetrahydrodipicolinate synthase
METPERPHLTGYWTRIWDGRLAEAIAYAHEHGLDELSAALGGWYTCYPGRADYFTPLGRVVPLRRSVIGLPMGGYPHSRPPQGLLPEAAKGQMRAAFEKAGLAKAEQPANV